MSKASAGALAARRWDLTTPARARFLRRTYAHLLGAIAAVIAIELWLFSSGLAERLAARMLSVSWLLILGAFMVLGWLARSAAYRVGTLPAQYAGLALYVVAKSVILVPLLYLAERVAPGAIADAGWVTAVGAVGLSAVVYVTRKDFSFLRALLYWGGLAALVLIVAALAFGFRLGWGFDVAMIALAGGSILYDTSKLLRRPRYDRYVAAALELFASVALMFWYLLRLLRRFGRT